jgi:uncharacterized protein YjbI with pentapeptide repeats
MANADHVEKFIEGPKAWNDWRAGNSSIAPDLTGTSLQWKSELSATGVPLRYNLSGCRLGDIEITHDLSGTSFFKAELSRVVFKGGLSGADFRQALLKNVDMSNGQLWGCKFAGARLQDCNLEGASFGPPLQDASGKAKTAGQVPEMGFENVIARDCLFIDADLTGASLRNAVLAYCDLREARGIVLDGTVLRGTLLSSHAEDGWSVLRRTYTGANMVFLLLASAAFFLPWLLEAAYWSGVTQVQQQTAAGAADLQARLATVPLDPALKASLFLVLEELATSQAALCVGEGNGGAAGVAAGCYRQWQVLLGWHAGVAGGITSALLIVYNFLRLGLTWLVAPLRDEELRSLQAPPLVAKPPTKTIGARWFAVRQSYGWMVPLHKCLRFLFWPAIAFGIWNIFITATGNVWIG